MRIFNSTTGEPLMNRDTLCTPVFAFFNLSALIAFVIVLFQRLSSLIALTPYISSHLRFLRSVLGLLSFWLLQRSSPHTYQLTIQLFTDYTTLQPLRTFLVILLPNAEACALSHFNPRLSHSTTRSSSTFGFYSVTTAFRSLVPEVLSPCAGDVPGWLLELLVVLGND
jgi:hypothetical protein